MVTTLEKTFPAQVDGGGEDIAEMYVGEVQALSWDTELVNNRRALRALAAVETYGGETETLGKESLSTILGDLLGDLRHLGEAAGFDVEETLLGTLSNYGDELCERYR